MAFSKHFRFRNTVVTDLKIRNIREKRFENIIKLCDSLRESADFLEKENFRLKVLNAKIAKPELKTEDSTETAAFDNSIITHHQKVYQLQTEITELHRNKSEHVQRIIDLKREKEEKEKEILQKTQEIENLSLSLKASVERQDMFEDKATDAETNLQLVKDEYSALLLTYTSLEKAKQVLESEHKEMTDRWLIYKAKAADELNAENEMMQMLQQMRVKKEMEEALREHVPSTKSDKRRETS